jgi:hypothetical protein
MTPAQCRAARALIGMSLNEWDWPPRQLKRFPPPLIDLRLDHVTDDTASWRSRAGARGAFGKRYLSAWLLLPTRLNRRRWTPAM